MMKFSATFREVLNVIFPPLCLNCKKRTNGALCSGCETKVEILSAFYCPRCNRRLVKSVRCSVCKTSKELGERFVLAAASPYQNKAVRELIHVLKYQNMKTALEPLRDIINKYTEKIIRDLEIRNWIIIPIPLHPKKEKERGFNQALLVSEVLSKVLCYSITPEPRIEINNLVRIKKTKSQTEVKDYEERKRNVGGAFALKNPRAVAAKNIILVDDVFTSGATMKEAVRVLKEAGAKKIIGFVVAKA